jgi:hypothetical protein
MKRWGVWAALVLLLAGCGEGARTDLNLQDVAYATVSHADGTTFSTSYTFVLSERVLLGRWSKNGPGQGYRFREEDLSLSAEQADTLQSLIDGIHIVEPGGSGECWEDTAALSLEVTDDQGSERRYPTDPEKERCNGAKLFAEKEDVQAFLEACRALLPEPSF